MADQRLPLVDGDDGQWGDILNQYLEKEHYNTAADNPANGGHQTVTIRPGNTSAGTAPLKFTSGSLLDTPEPGAVEFLNDKFYLTQTTGAARKVIAAYTDTLGAEGDLYYRDASANFVRLPVGSGTDIMRVTSGIPAWGAVPAVGLDHEIQFNDNSVLGSSTNFTYDNANSRVVIGENAAVLPDNPLAIAGDADGYLQINIQNKSTGTNASSDYVATADDGNDSSKYVDLGINNSAYSNVDFDIMGPHDSYLFGEGGDLVVGSLTTGKTIKMFVSGTNQEAHPADVSAVVDADGINLPTGKTFRINGVSVSAAGEVNTASNYGTSGVGLYDSKNTYDLRFKNIDAASTKITVTNNPTNHTVDLDLGTVALADLTDDATHRIVTDTEKSAWNAKEDPVNKNTANGYAGLDANGNFPLNKIASLGTNTDTTMDHVLSEVFSAGWFHGGVISDAGSGNIDIAAGTGFLRISDSDTAAVKYISWGALTGQNIASGINRHVVINYNSGSPIVQLLASPAPTDRNTYIYLGEVYNIAGSLRIFNVPRPSGDIIRRIVLWVEDVIGNRVTAGEMVSDASPSSRKIAITAGTLYDRTFKKITTAAFDSSGAGTFVSSYRDGSGGWTYVTGQTDWDNLYYDDNTGTLNLMTDGYYANAWVCRNYNGDVFVQYGQNEYATQVLAEAEGQPSSRPRGMNTFGYYVGQITFLKGASSPARINQIKPTMAGGGATAGSSVHSELAGLQGGAQNEYFHLTSAERTIVGNTSGTNTGDQSEIQNLIGGNGTTLLGSIPYQSGTNTTTQLAPNTTTTKKFLRQTGTGTNGAAPVWDTLGVADVPTMTATVGGLVPTPPNNTTDFLRGDGTFAAPLSASGLSQQQIMAIGSMRM